jgi:hypothetical protein
MDGNKLPKYISLLKEYYKGKHTYKIYVITIKDHIFLKSMVKKIFITKIFNIKQNIFGLIKIIQKKSNKFILFCRYKLEQVYEDKKIYKIISLVNNKKKRLSIK